MRAIRSARFILWLGCVLAYFAATHAADRSPANMASAANTFLSSLTPEQTKVAAFAFDNVAERERFGFVPTEMHPRVGLTIEKMTPPQREAAHNLLKSGLSQKGYMTATAWQDSFTEGYNMLGIIEDAMKAGSGWQPKAVEVTAVVVTKDSVAGFLKEHPDAIGQ